MTRDQLQALTVAELRRIAETHHLTGLAKMKKDDLVAALLPLVGPKGDPLPAPTAPPAASQVPVQPAAPAQPHGITDPGLPIPERYGIDRIVLMVQDPTHVFAYWEIASETYLRVEAEAGGSCTPVLVIESEAGSEQREVDVRGGNYYLAVAPATTYTARLALRDRQGRLHLLAAASNPVTTPVAGPSWRTDESWMAVEEHWEEWLAKADPARSESSLARFAKRKLSARTVAVGEEELPAEAVAELALVEAMAGATGVGGLSSAALAKGPSWSSHALAASGGPSSWGLLASHSLGSHNLASHSLSSKALSSGSLGSHSRWAAEPTYHQVDAGLTDGPAQPAPAITTPTAPAPAPWADVPVASTGSAPAAGGPQPTAPAPAAATPAPRRPSLIRGPDTVKPDQGRVRPA